MCRQRKNFFLKFYFTLLMILLVHFNAHFWLPLSKRDTSTKNFGGRLTPSLSPPHPPTSGGPETGQISLPDCLYFSRYWVTCTLPLFPRFRRHKFWNYPQLSNQAVFSTWLKWTAISAKSRDLIHYERSRFLWWQVEIFSMIGRDLHEDRSKFSVKQYTFFYKKTNFFAWASVFLT